jgi:hypothetical protein
VAANRIKHRCQICTRTGERSNLIQTRGERHQPVSRDAPIRWFHTERASECSRKSNAATRVRTERNRGDARRDHCARTTARAAWHSRRIPRIFGHAKRTVFGARAHAKLVEIDLADADSPSIQKTLNTRCGVRRNEMLERPRARCGAGSRHAKVVFECDRNSRENPNRFTSSKLGIDGLGFNDCGFRNR